MFELETDDVELFGTVEMAWNELLLDNRSADDAAIVAETHVWHHFDESQAQEPIADARVVFAVVFAAILTRFPKAGAILAKKPLTFKECPQVRLFLPAVQPATSPT
jgi:hypothetical protein